MDTVSIDSRSLYTKLGSPAAPLLLDVRRAAAFDADPHLIAAAVRPEGDLASFATRVAAGRAVVAYCVHGHEVSQEAARSLRAAGLKGAYLEGGIEAWRAAGT